MVDAIRRQAEGELERGIEAIRSVIDKQRVALVPSNLRSSLNERGETVRTALEKKLQVRPCARAVCVSHM